MKNSKPILVTGSHRSGTTWVGKMLSISPDVIYIHEPFHTEHDIGVCSAKFLYMYTYICDQNENNYYDQIHNIFNFRYNLISKLKTSWRPRDVGREIKKYIQFVIYRQTHKIPLIKDPIALFSAEWLASRFNMNAVVLIRHPAAFACSLKEKNWKYPFSHFLKQKLLMRDHLYPFYEEIKYFVDEEQDIIDQAALLWKIIHFMIHKYKSRNRDWIFIRHEDLSQEPVIGFQDLYTKLNLRFTSNVQSIIDRHCYTNENLSADRYEFPDVYRDSVSNIWRWKKVLSMPEVDRIKSRVEGIAQEYYSDDEW